MPRKNDEWTPYGLEAIRQARIWRGRLLAALAALGALLAGTALVETTTTESLRISANGNDVTDSVSIPEPDLPKKQDYVTVSLTPGRVSRVESGNDPAPPQVVERPSAPHAVRASPYPWKLWLLDAVPYALAGGVAALLFRGRGPRAEVNYGVYKGAMPLELLTAHHQRAVVTTRHARASVFGKRRADYLPPETRDGSGEG